MEMERGLEGPSVSFLHPQAVASHLQVVCTQLMCTRWSKVQHTELPLFDSLKWERARLLPLSFSVSTSSLLGRQAQEPMLRSTSRGDRARGTDHWAHSLSVFISTGEKDQTLS